MKESLHLEKITVVLSVLFITLLFLTACTPVNYQDTLDTQRFVDSPYIVNVPLESRSISFENTTGQKGQGGKAASNLGVGRKGAAEKFIDPGQSITLCDIEGPGVIRHIWSTTASVTPPVVPWPDVLLGIVIRVYWDNQEHPSIEMPIGNFYGISHGIAEKQAYQSAAHSVSSKAGMNIWLPMPFAKRALVTITNETSRTITFFYSIDYTINDQLSEPFGRLHILYRRENPTTAGKDFEILPKRSGMGRFIGCVLGVRPANQWWWGEGEVKVYLDGDKEFPTIAGTGTEDYIGQSWGLQQKADLYCGATLDEKGLFSIYRWHMKDPIYWKKDIRVTIQQLGYTGSEFVDREDDWSTTTFWYEPIPSKPLPAMPDFKSRIADYKWELYTTPKKQKKKPAVPSEPNTK